MTATEINTLIGTILVFVTAIASACKWVLIRVDEKQKATEARRETENLTLALRESEARAELSRRLHDEIRVLREELNSMHANGRVMMRRIYDLERVIHNTPGLDLPLTEGWPLI